MNFHYEHREQQMQACPFRDFIFKEHLHKETEVVFVQEGSLILNIQNSQKVISAGDAALILPNMMHSFQTIGKSKGILIIFDMHMAGDYEKLLTGYQCIDPFIPKDKLPEQVPMCVNSLMREDLIDKPAFMRGYIAVLLGNLFDILKLEKISKKKKYTDLNTVLSYITTHYREPISLENIEAETGIGKYTISRIFSRELPCNFKEYLNSLRIGYSQHLLSIQNIPITEVAYESGFSSLRSFNRSFRNIHHMSPREYRQQLNNI